MTLFSLGDKLTEDTLSCITFQPVQKSVLLVMLQSKDIKAGEWREKIFPYGSVNLQASGVFLNARFQLCTDRFACIHMALVNKFILQPLQREK